MGSDAIGAIRKLSEVVGREAAKKFLIELNSISTVDVHLAGMLIFYMALSRGFPSFLVRSVTEHLFTNIGLMKKFLGVIFRISRINNAFKVKCS